MSKFLVRLTSVLVLLTALGGCGLVPGLGDQATSEPPAAEMLPDLPGYAVVEGQTLTDYISKLSGGAALLAAQPELTATIAAVDSIIQCYQEVGAARARLYSNMSNPLSSGTVAIADRNALMDPKNLFKCVVPVGLGVQSVETGLKPCTANYTLAKGGNEFYILYAGTTPEICQAFCSKLEGCTAHK